MHKLTSFRNVVSKHPFMKTQDPVHPFGQPFIMRGNNSRRAFLPHEAEEFSKNDNGSMFVQIAGRLVSKNKGRAVGERASDGDALLFASRKLAWGKLGRAHVCTPVSNANLVCR